MWAIEDSPGPKAAYRGGSIILPPAILLMRHVLRHATVCIYSVIFSYNC